MVLIKVHILRRSGIPVFSAILITLFLTGCNRGISASQLAHINAYLDDLAIVPEPITCFPKYKPWAGDPISGFGRGTGEGAVTGLDMLGHGGSGEGPLAGFAALVFAVGGGVIGGTVGACQSVPKEVSSGIQKIFVESVDHKNINESISCEIYSNSLKTRSDLNPVIIKRQISPTGKDDVESQDVFYERLKQEGKKTALHIKTTRLILEVGRGRTPSYTLHIQIHTELVSLANNHIFFHKDYEYISKEKDWDSWGQFRGSLTRELALACNLLGKRIYMEQIEMPARGARCSSGLILPSAEISRDACIFCPVCPALALKGPIETFAGADGFYIKATEADSMQSTLKRDSFLCPGDKTAVNSGKINRVSNAIQQNSTYSQACNKCILCVQILNVKGDGFLGEFFEFS